MEDHSLRDLEVRCCILSVTDLEEIDRLVLLRAP